MDYTELLKDYNTLPRDYQVEVENFISFLKTKLIVKKKKSEPKKRILGKGKNVVSWIAPDFDAPLEDMKEYME